MIRLFCEWFWGSANTKHVEIYIANPFTKEEQTVLRFQAWKGWVHFLFEALRQLPIHLGYPWPELSAGEQWEHYFLHVTEARKKSVTKGMKR